MNKKVINRLALVLGTSSIAVSALASSVMAEEKTELTVWVRNTTAAAVQDAADEYNASQDAVEIKVVEQVNTQMADQLSLALAANEAPDIVALDCTKVPYFASVGAFTDITDKYNSLEFKDKFAAGMVNSGQIDGTTYAIPFAPDVSVLLYNKDHYEEAGLDPEVGPATWEDLVEYSKKLTTDDHYGYVYAGAHPGAYMFCFMPYVWGNGGDFLTEDGKECVFDSQEAKEAIQLYYDMTNEYKVVPPSSVSYSWGEAQDAFLTGKASQIVLGSAAVYNFVNGTAEMNWGACLIPKGPNGDSYASFSGGDNIGITSQCSDVEAAWDFIEFTMSDAVQIERFAKGGLLPARSDQFDNEYFDVTPEYQVLKEAIQVAHTPYSLKYDEMYDPMLAAMQNCFNGKASIDDTVVEIKEKINAIVG